MSRPSIRTATGISVLVFCGVWAHRYTVRDRVGQLDRLRSEIMEMESRPHFESVISQMTRAASQFEGIEASIPPSPGVADVVARLTADLDDLETDRRHWNISPTVRSGEFEETGLDLAFRGSTESVYALLSRISSYPRVVRVMALSILADGGDPTHPRAVEVKLQIVSRPARPGRHAEERES